MIFFIVSTKKIIILDMEKKFFLSKKQLKTKGTKFIKRENSLKKQSIKIVQFSPSMENMNILCRRIM